MVGGIVISITFDCCVVVEKVPVFVFAQSLM